jgi:hypothetical protein
MTDKPAPTPPREPLVWPPNAREVAGVPFAIIGADHLRPRPPAPTTTSASSESAPTDSVGEPITGATAAGKATKP